MATMINAHLTRQSDLIPTHTLQKSINIIGAGAIGSFTALMLAKMGLEDITVWDYDTVSIENMNCQGYRYQDIGKPKVEALANIVESYTNVKIKTMNRAWSPQTAEPMRGIVISCADSMAVRRQLFEHLKTDFRVEWFLDSRMGAESALMYVMNPQKPTDQTAYEATLYTNEQAVQEPCTAKATIFTANLLAGHVVKAVKNLIVRQPYARVTMWNIAENQMTCYTAPIQ